MDADRLLFVYGSLMRGQSAHALLEDSRYLRRDRTVAGYRVVQYRGFPGLLRAPEDRVGVVGELFEVVAPTRWPEIDAYEECPHVYVRCMIRLASGATAQGYLLREHRWRAAGGSS